MILRRLLSCKRKTACTRRDRRAIVPVVRPDGESDRHATLEALLQEERTERDERRGLETRATTLLAASIAAVGFVVNATSSAELQDLTEGEILSGAVIATLLVVTFGSAIYRLQRALRVKSVKAGVRPGTEAPLVDRIKFHQDKVKRIETQNLELLDRLEASINALALGLVVLAAGLVWLLVVN